MKTNLHCFASLLAAMAGLSTAMPAMAADVPYHLLKTIPVREGGGWTAMAVDETGRRLYAAHGSRIEVINLNTETPAGAITDTPDVRGLAIAPAFHMGYATSGQTQSASLIDLNTLRTVAKMKTGANPGAMVFEASKLQLYAFSQGDHSATAGEADDGDFLATIDLGGQPVSALADTASYEAKGGRVFSSLKDKSEVITISVESHQVVNHWPTAPGQLPHGLAYDAANHRLFVACGNQLMIVMDSTSGKVIANVPAGNGAGDVAYDPGTREIFYASGDGTVTIAHEDAPDKITVVQTLKTAPGASVLAVDGKMHRLYLGSADFKSSDGLTIDGMAPGPNPIPGTLKILVYGN